MCEGGEGCAVTLSERMAKAFAALNDDGRRFWLGVVEEEVRRVQAARRPVLRLFESSLPVITINKAPASVRTKWTEPT